MYESTSREYLTQVGDIREGFSEKAASRLSTEGCEEVRNGQKLFKDLGGKRKQDLHSMLEVMKEECL